MEDYKEITKKSYDDNNDYHSKKHNSCFDLSRRVEFGKFIDLISGDKKYLDVGCGNGSHAKYFQSRGLSPVCIDISDKMIELCKKEELESYVMDLENLKFEDGSFDGIWAVTSIIHVPKTSLNKVVDDFARILKDDGVLFVSVQVGDFEGFIDDKNDPKFKRYFSYFEKDELIGYFSDKFDLIEIVSTEAGGRMFWNVFFRKK